MNANPPSVSMDLAKLLADPNYVPSPTPDADPAAKAMGKPKAREANRAK